MNYIAFEEPVSVLVGLGLPSRVENVMEACALLDDWPPSKRDSAHAIALKACRAALAGDIDAETARATFVAFARRANLLAPEVDGAIASRAAVPERPRLAN